jgi:hypothetical protein
MNHPRLAFWRFRLNIDPVFLTMRREGPKAKLSVKNGPISLLNSDARLPETRSPIKLGQSHVMNLKLFSRE